MTKNNSPRFSLWRLFVKKVKKMYQWIQEPVEKYTAKYPLIAQGIQLTFVYFFAVIDLCYAVLNNVFSLGYIPELLLPIFPFISWILQSPFFKVWASPEKVFFLSYVVIEFMVVRSAFNFSKLVKYNILLVFALLMIQGLIVSYWDLIFNREIATPVAKWAYDQGMVIYTDKNLAISFFMNTFFSFMFLYLYLYVTALRGKFANVPGTDWLTDSIAFWLRIKTPTMRFGKRKKEGEEEDEDADIEDQNGEEDQDAEEEEDTEEYEENGEKENTEEDEEEDTEEDIEKQ
jgi:hypothetical protein